MITLATVLVGFGIILIIMGGYFLHKHYTKMEPNEKLEWLGYGKHPFRKNE